MKAQEAYVVMNNNTWKFYYDTKRESREGRAYLLHGENENPVWNLSVVEQARITTADFDPSFVDARPKSTRYWFQGFYKLTEIKNLQYLNTSEVTDMFGMFQGCRALTTVDVSHFDTGKVTDMVNMFSNCTELTNIIMGSQFTSDESTNMDALFANCSKLCKVTFIGDIPTSINSKFFNGVGTAVAPATLVVPEQYEANFQAKFDGNMFYGGYFTLAGVEFKKGDLNFDGEVSDDDLEKMVRLIILGMYEANADLNGDGVVNVADIVELVKIINSDNGTGSGYFWMGNYMPKSNTFPTINGKEVEGIVTTYTSLDDAMAKASRTYSAGEYAIVMYPLSWGVKDDLVFLDSANKKYYATKQKNLPDFPDYLYYESIEKIGANTTMTLSTEVVAKAAGATLSSK